MTDKQQPFKMPEPAEYACIGGVSQDIFTADQVRAAYEQGLEDAAKECDRLHEQSNAYFRAYGSAGMPEHDAKDCAAYIRNLKDTTK